jgi:hypothetical protein
MIFYDKVELTLSLVIILTLELVLFEAYRAYWITWIIEVGVIVFAVLALSTLVFAWYKGGF